ncbi:DUF2254 domain-containing protein [Spirosoma oryzicola]|uniref:DUF2254 domain-containing protein n=1 Tax=Spirosoma oryzicola TaxID=2898794 RepID=UPI001E6205D7|nr:DUF2254 domain-containing protein [Spirosoma oryzicola]UHG93803.1 DUF2254 domain-containing protein [Spirosoma oryzicola]
MTTHLRQYWQQLRESLWFVPGLLVLASFGMAYGLVEFDAHTSWHGEKQFPLLFGSGAEGARAMLGAIAGSMLTVATLSFSLTLSTISQVSNQYSPRVLRNFMSDKVNQVVMGYFVGVFAYCLIVLGTIRGTDEIKFVPATAVLVGLFLALGGVAALIFFIHHIAESIQTGTIVQHTFHETQKAIAHFFPDQFGEPIDDPQQSEAALRYVEEQTGWYPVKAGQVGYLQLINTDGLLKWATRHRVVLRIEKEMGAFMSEGTVLFLVRSDMERPKAEKADWPDDLLDYVSIGRHRNIEQDVAFGIQQLLDISLKALSPGINDTTTAIMAVDYLGAVCEQLARREFPARLRSDGKHLRVLVRRADFADYIRLAFDLPLINAKDDHAVLRRLLVALATVNEAVCSADRKPVLRELADRLVKYADQMLKTDYEKRQVQELYNDLMKTWS